MSCNQGMMTTSFTKEWSDDDSSHSSEEFMYVKGGVEGVEGSETKSDEGERTFKLIFNLFSKPMNFRRCKDGK